MKLFKWVEKRGMSDKDLADALGISAPAITAYKKGKTSPSLLNAIKLVRLTQGMVGFEDLCVELQGDTPQEDDI